MTTILRLCSKDRNFQQQLDQRLARMSSDTVSHSVQAIIEDVRKRGDEALLEYTRRFDQPDCPSASVLEIPRPALQDAFESLNKSERHALHFAHERIRAFAEREKPRDWQLDDSFGNMLGQRYTPIERAGLYVPGGKAAYPSSVLMNAIPARVAGVDEIIMVSPTSTGQINPYVLAAAHIAGVDQTFRIGGAQAVAALAYGTQIVPRVDKIVGPGNIFVATAKKLVFGQVGIDMIAGPSEVLIIADDSADPDWLAMDLFAQAEHDENAQAILITTNPDILDRVQQSINRLLPKQPRRPIIAASLQQRGLFIVAKSLQECAEIANVIAPEHLELAVDNPQSLLPVIRHAGAIFIGHYSAEAFGDYCAGPNHVLPTAGTARFASPLGVGDFMKRSSLIHCHPQGVQPLIEPTGHLARAEGLFGHAESANNRKQS